MFTENGQAFTSPTTGEVSGGMVANDATTGTNYYCWAKTDANGIIEWISSAAIAVTVNVIAYI